MRTILSASKNGVLRQKAQDIPATEIKSKRVRELISDMKTILTKEKYGVALAAPQVGEAIKLFIVSGRALARDSRNAPDEPQRLEARSSKLEAILPDQIYINPELIKISRKKIEKHEGCLSIRGKWGTVPRAEKATIRAYDERGRKFTRGASGFLAHVFQHEMDHLQGVLYIDKATHIYDEKE